MGRSASGKTSIAREVSYKLGLRTIKSYTTRPPRNEAERQGISDHIFIQPEQVAQFNHVAYTKIGEYEYFCTQEQLDEADLYVIDPVGYEYLKARASSTTELLPIYICTEDAIRYSRASERSDQVSLQESRYKAEEDQFSEFESTYEGHVVRNNGTLEEAVDQTITIIKQYL